MKKSILISIIIIFLSSSFVLGAKNLNNISRKEKREILRNLAPKYKKWFNLITYLSTKEERNVFLMLSSDRDRDIFIKSFWLQRDPTPGTPVNEFKMEMEKRFRYVNSQFKRESSKPGWMTDMGKFYMILGKPNQIDRFANKAGLYPAQVWYYYGDKTLGLPTYFNITFYKPRNTTSWKLYNPAQDGPQALMINHDPVDTTDYLSLYNRIKKLAPGLADPSISMVPNEQTPGISPSLRANLILSSIYESPRRDISSTYATNFLNYKGYVDINSSINYIENVHSVNVFRTPRFNFSFINITVKPKTISLGFSKKDEKYFFNFKLTVSIKKDEKFLYQYSKNYDFYVLEKNVESFKKGVEIHDILPVIPGKYKLTVFVQNTIGKQFSYFDKIIDIPDPSSSPFLTKPIIGYKVEKQPDNYFFPYYINGNKIFFDAEKIFKVKSMPIISLGAYGLSKEIWEKGKVEIEVSGLSSRRKFKKKKIIKLKDYTYTRDLNISENLVDTALYSDYYRVNIKLISDKGIVMDSKGVNFTVAPTKNVGYPFESFKRSRLENPFYFDYILGIQYENAGFEKMAVASYEKCISDNSDFVEGRIRFLKLLNKMKEYTKVLARVDKLKSSEKYKFEYHYIKGAALFGMKDFEKALNELLNANKVYDSDLRVLNLLGYTLFNLKEYKEAQKVLKSSVSLDKNQPLIKNMLLLIKKKLKQSK